MQNSPAASRGGSGSHGVRLPINIHSSSNSSGGGGRGSGGRWGRVWLSEGWGREWVPCKAARQALANGRSQSPRYRRKLPPHTRTKPRDRRRHTDQAKTNTCKCKAHKRQIQGSYHKIVAFPITERTKYILFVSYF